MDAAIEACGLTKRFAGTAAVAGIDIAVPTGTVLGLLGRNGAGKTTTVRMLATLTRPDAGRAAVAGFDVVTEAARVRAVIGLTGQFAAVDLAISAWENLYLVARLHGAPARAARARTDDLLARFDLTAHARKPARVCSGGQRRRIDLAASMLADPQVLFLDEPTTGLDPHTRKALWDAVRAMVADGTTVLLTTQYMEEAQALADRVVVLDDGVVVAAGSTAELRARVGEEVLRVRPADPVDTESLAAALRAAGLAGVAVDRLTATVSARAAGVPELTRAVRAVAGTGVAVAELTTGAPSLDEAFIALTTRAGRCA